MNKKEAKDIVRNTKDGDWGGIWLMQSYERSKGFLEGYDKAEKNAEVLVNALEKVRLWFNPSDSPGGFAACHTNIYIVIFSALQKYKATKEGDKK
jgi:hypothetical protein